MTAGIYAIWNRASNTIYIGSSNNIERRWSEHRRRLNGGTHSVTELQADWRALGEAAFTFQIVKPMESPTAPALLQAENHTADWYSLSYKMYNRHNGGLTRPDGEELTMCDLCRLSGINESTIRYWMRKGLFAPVREEPYGTHTRKFFDPSVVDTLRSALRSK